MTDAIIKRYWGIIKRSEQRAIDAYIAKDMTRYRVNVTRYLDAKRALQRMGVIR